MDTDSEQQELGFKFGGSIAVKLKKRGVSHGRTRHQILPRASSARQQESSAEMAVFGGTPSPLGGDLDPLASNDKAE
jgi:hypothetical protein